MRILLANDEHDELFYLINDPDIEVIDDEDELENNINSIEIYGILNIDNDDDGVFILRQPEYDNFIINNTEFCLSFTMYDKSIFSTYILKESNDNFVVNIFHENKLICRKKINNKDFLRYDTNQWYVNGKIYEYNTRFTDGDIINEQELRKYNNKQVRVLIEFLKD